MNSPAAGDYFSVSLCFRLLSMGRTCAGPGNSSSRMARSLSRCSFQDKHTTSPTNVPRTAPPASPINMMLLVLRKNPISAIMDLMPVGGGLGDTLVGASVGSVVGDSVGVLKGDIDGWFVLVGALVGSVVGDSVGVLRGDIDGWFALVGASVGSVVRDSVVVHGWFVGEAVGASVGAMIGNDDGGFVAFVV